MTLTVINTDTKQRGGGTTSFMMGKLENRRVLARVLVRPSEASSWHLRHRDSQRLVEPGLLVEHGCGR